MNDEAARQGRPANTNTAPLKIAASGDATGLQAGHISTVRQAQGLREVLSPRQYASYVDLCWRHFDRERQRPDVMRWLRTAA